MTYYACPVCDFVGLDTKPYEVWPPPGVELRPPYRHQLGRPSYEVCLRCGFEFGNDDDPGTAAPLSFVEYRAEWLAEGRPWSLQGRAERLGHAPTIEDRS
jgi:hypothetical protein